MFARISGWAAAAAVLLARNAITIAGTSLTTLSAFFVALLLFLGLFGIANAPYVGLITFLMLPGFFVLGLLLIPIGLIYDRIWGAKRREAGADPYTFVIDLKRPQVRRAVVLIATFSLLNLFVLSAVTYEGVVYMESNQFCGAACHSVMHPEFIGYDHSPHAEVRCVECHIGSGAQSYVEAKLSGVRQVVSLMTNSYARPIPTPVHNFRPAREICGECHAGEQSTGDKLKLITKYAEDDDNTELTTAMLLHLGDQGQGIHGYHNDPDRDIRFLATDESREEIALVRVREADGTVTNYAADGFEGDPEAVADAAMRRMDCIDCHNRPAHTFEMPGPAIDAALHAGRIDTGLPGIKSAGLEALNAAATADDPAGLIATQLQQYYADNPPAAIENADGAVNTAIAELQAIFSQNVFPSMKIEWGTYPVHDSHIDSPGCFRCHDDAHTSPAGNAIRQDCAMCHDVLAWDEPEPAILEALGMN